MNFSGLGVALATPFTSGLTATGGMQQPRVDHVAYDRLLQHTIADGEGADFLIALGSTGEAATVTDEERAALITQTVAAARPHRLPVVVGVGHNDTVRTCDMARQAAELGADAVLVVTPYYNKPQASGIVAHFRAVAEAVPGLPIIAYNVPGRTGTNLTPAIMQRLWTVDQVVALKESSGDLGQITEICQQAPEGRHVVAGDDNLALPSIAVGAQGLVSVCGNVAPRETHALVHAALEGDLVEARRLNLLLADLMAALFAESNPVPVKAALACLGLGTATVRAPLSPAEPETWGRVQTALAAVQSARHPGVDTTMPRVPETAADLVDDGRLAS